MIKKPVIGISGCLAGSAVRFDGGHKRADFLMDKLVEWVTFRPVCPEMAIGLPVPRPALRLVRSTQGNIRMCFSHDQNEDVTERMTEFSKDMASFCGQGLAAWRYTKPVLVAEINSLANQLQITIPGLPG